MPSPRWISRSEDGEFLVLVGPSGCGKTTALRMVAGLEEITEGEIRIGERVVNHVPPRDRDIAMVFQSYALYPHLSVRENIAFGLKMRKLDKQRGRAAGRERRPTSSASSSCLDKKPRALSGGQRQRVAMGRAIVREPQAFLMDEPLSNLDAKLRVQVRAEISALQRNLGTTTIYVTHDQVEAMTMGHRVAVMRKGELQQVGRSRGALRPAGEPVRRRLHRQPRDEPAGGAARATRRRLRPWSATSGSSSIRSCCRTGPALQLVRGPRSDPRHPPREPRGRADRHRRPGRPAPQGPARAARGAGLGDRRPRRGSTPRRR